MAPDYERPSIDTPQSYASAQQADGMNLAADTRWWESFRDPELTLLMQTALQKNLDIEQALAAV